MQHFPNTNQSHQHLAIPSSHDDNHNNTEITLFFLIQLDRPHFLREGESPAEAAHIKYGK